MRVAGELVGGCELRLVAGGRGEISYWTFPQFRGHRYASRAARLVADWALSTLALAHVEIHVEGDNLAAGGDERRLRRDRTHDCGRALVYERGQA